MNITDASRQAAIATGHANDAAYIAKSMSNSSLPASTVRYNLMLNAWVREQTHGQFGFDDASTQQYFDQASVYGLVPPDRKTLQEFWDLRHQTGSSKHQQKRYRKSGGKRTRRSINRRRKSSNRNVRKSSKRNTKRRRL